MKWIGQNIYDQISRFRNDVYLEDISTGTIVSGGHLGLDSNNKIVKAVDGGGDLTSIVAGEGLSGTSLTGPIPTINIDSAQPTITSLGTLTALAVDSIALDTKTIQILGDTNDVFSITTGAAGATTMTTTDDAGADGHFEVAADGNITLDSANVITLESVLNTNFESGGNFRFFKADNGDDFLGLTIGTHGDATFATTDAAATAAHFEIDADGDITLDAAGDIALEAEGNDVTVDTDNFTIFSATDTKPLLEIKSTGNTTKGSNLVFTNDKGAAGADGDTIGTIGFQSDNDAQQIVGFGLISSGIIDASDGNEAGKIQLSVSSKHSSVASSQTSNGIACIGYGASTDGNYRVDVEIGNAVQSVTTIAGTLTMGSTAFVNNSGVIQVATQGTIDHDSLANFAANEHFTQANITTVGTIDTGVWNGTAIASAYLDADTAHLTTAQTFTGAKTFGTTTKLQFRDANAYINSPDANDLEIAATDITLDAAGTVTVEADDLVINSPNANDPLVNIINDANDSTSGRLRFLNRRGADGQDNDETGIIEFFSFDDGTPAGERYSRIIGTIHDATAGQESGKLTFQVASHDGEDVDGLVITGGDAEDVVDVTIGNGTTSVTQVAGALVEHGRTRIKILPSDFIADDGGRPVMIDDVNVGSERLFLETHATNPAYATIDIPTGYKAEKVMIYGASTSPPAVEVWEFQIDSNTGVSKGTGNVDTEINITDVTSTETNYLFIQVSQGSGDEIHGGYVTIDVA